MSNLNLIISALNLLGLGGLGIFLYYLFAGLKERVNTLTQLAEEQKMVLDAVRDRASEIEKLGQSYKKAFADFSEMGEKLEARRQDLIRELEAANSKKDEELAKLKSLELQEIELKEESLRRIPDLEQKLEDQIRALSRQLEIVSPSVSSHSYLDYTISTFNYDRLIHGRKGMGKTTFLNYLIQKKLLDALSDSEDDSSQDSKRDDDDNEPADA